jgi:hypothetical protein
MLFIGLRLEYFLDFGDDRSDFIIGVEKMWSDADAGAGTKVEQDVAGG